jgi:hypothetical protein
VPLSIVLSDNGRVSFELPMKQDERFRNVRVLSFKPSNSVQGYTVFYSSERRQQRQNGGNG